MGAMQERGNEFARNCWVGFDGLYGTAAAKNGGGAPANEGLQL